LLLEQAIGAVGKAGWLTNDGESKHLSRRVHDPGAGTQRSGGTCFELELSFGLGYVEMSTVTLIR
jgi:hypothetical protein